VLVTEDFNVDSDYHVDIGPDLSELFENVTGVRFFETPCIYHGIVDWT